MRCAAQVRERLGMSARAVAVVGAGSSFGLATVAGVLGNQLGSGWWAWVAFVAVLVIGIVVTGMAAYHTASNTPGPTPPAVPRHGKTTIGNVTTQDGTAVGINYGTINHRSGQARGRRRR
jgi:hypothetical protein